MAETPEDINALLDEYTPIVRRIARSACYCSAAIDMADLYQIGEIAVLRAIKAYDPSAGMNIKSFVARCVKQDIYNEAARFLGVFTVDHRVTSLAAKVHKLHSAGHTDQEIAVILNKTRNRNFDAEHVHDLRVAYHRRQQTPLEDHLIQEDITEEKTIKELLDNIIHDNNDRVILEKRILGHESVKDVATILNLPQRRIYSLEHCLRNRIRIAIEDATE